MAQIPGSVPLTGKVAPTDTTDTFATHIDIYGEGGYMTVANQAERDAITTERRKQGMAVFQNSTNEMYILQGGVANTNWTLFSGGSGAGNLQDTMDLGSTATGLTTDVDITTSGDMSLNFGSTPTDQFNLIGGNISVQSGYGIDIDSTAGDITLSGSNLIVGGIVGTPSIGDVLSASDASGTLTWTTLPSSADNMQNVFDNSTPNVTATDVTKNLSLSAGEANILTYDSSGGSSNIILQANNSVTGTVNELKINGGANTTVLTTNNLDVEIRVSNTTAGPEVGDVLMIDSLQGAGSTYGRLEYKAGVQLYRKTISSPELRNLFTTPVQLLTGIPSRYLMILQAYVFLDTQIPLVPYNAGVRLEIQNDSSSDPILQTNEFLQSTVQAARTFYPMDPATVGPNDRPVSASAGWQLGCSADPGNLGTGTLSLWITYMVLP